VYHQLVFIWIRDPAVFGEYLRALPPVVARYGGAADLSLRPTATSAGGLTLPDIVNLVHYDDRESFERFGADPDFREIEPLRARSVDLHTFEGQLSLADPSPHGSAHRLYEVELATYRDGSGAAYRTYEQADEPRRRRHGYRVEYLLDAQTAPAGRPRPDLIKISSFPDTSAKAAFDADPAHTEIEEKLYPAGADNVVRLTAHAMR
jgi:uncharacterized protein (DUF1330 family)